MSIPAGSRSTALKLKLALGKPWTSDENVQRVDWFITSIVSAGDSCETIAKTEAPIVVKASAMSQIVIYFYHEAELGVRSFVEQAENGCRVRRHGLRRGIRLRHEGVTCASWVGQMRHVGT